MKKNILITFALGCIMYATSQALPPCTSPDPVTNTENSILYASVLVADDIFASTYIPQPDMFARDKAIVLTCMDPRLMPNQFMGFVAGDMYVIRNAGGLATRDMMRSLIIAYKLLGANQIFVVQHTDCGMLKFTNKVMTNLLKESIVTASLVDPCQVSIEPMNCNWENVCECSGQKSCKNYNCIDWHAITENLNDSVVKTVKKIRKNPLIPSDVPIYGFIFDVLTGELIPVEKAIKIGRAKTLHCKN